MWPCSIIAFPKTCILSATLNVDHVLLQALRQEVIAELGEGEAAEAEIAELLQRSEQQLDVYEQRLALLKEHMLNLGCDCEALDRGVFEKACTSTATTAAFRDAGRIAAPAAEADESVLDDPFANVDAYEYGEDADTMTDAARAAKAAADRAIAANEAKKLSEARTTWEKKDTKDLTMTKFRGMISGAGG